MILDTHIHSTYSDGKSSIEEILRIVKEKNLDLIALTDHNTLSGHQEFKEACNETKVLGIPGVEITSQFLGEEIHVLGYFHLHEKKESFDELEKSFAIFKSSKRNQLVKMIEKMEMAGFSVSVDDYLSYLEKEKITNPNRVSIATYLMSKGISKSIKEVFDRLINDDCPFFVEREAITFKEAVDMIHHANGICVIAHFGEYQFTDEKEEAFILSCKELKVEGFELLHVHNTETDMRKLMGLKDQMNLIYTCGSDYHGGNKPNQIGKFHEDSKPIPEDILSFFENEKEKTYKVLSGLL